jgi:hypothetical protein
MMEIQSFTQIPAFRQEESLLKEDAINVYASMPCPMKVPFKQLMTAFAADYNATHALPVHCPDVMDCSSEELGCLVRNTKDPDRLPDIIITQNYEFFFECPFAEKFLQTGIFQGFTHAADREALPEPIRRNLEKSNLGVLCFGSRSVVRDLTVEGFPGNIRSWSELLAPAFEDQFTVHGHIDKATFGFMYFLDRHFGMEGIIRYAGNIADIRHFSQVIKRMCSTDEYRTSINILPDVAAAQIPSTKKVRILNLKEGKMLSPMIMAVKTSKMAQCSEILAFFHTKKFRAMLGGGCLLPDELERNRTWFMPDFDVLAKNYHALAKAFDGLYLNNLNREKISLRVTEGSVCKG